VPTIDQAVGDFLAQRRIAVVGVSREPGGKHGGNVVYQRLKARGYEVFAVNPNADTVEGDPCFHDLASIPGGVDAVVIATKPSVAPSVARECRELGITRVWMHRSFGAGSVSPEAHAFCRENGIASIAGGCPLMYGPTSDGGHRFMRSMLGLFGKLPKEA
jgi:predicted CoA-binding protein